MSHMTNDRKDAAIRNGRASVIWKTL